MKLCYRIWTIALLWAPPAFAFTPEIDLQATPGSGSPTLTLTVRGDIGDTPQLVGFDIVRRELAEHREGDGACSAGTRVTATPFLRQSGDYSFEVDDANLSTDHAYYYQVQPVDSDRKFDYPLANTAFDLRNARAVVSLGLPAVTEAWVEEPHTAFPNAIPCPSCCFPQWQIVVHFAPEVSPSLFDGAGCFRLYGVLTLGIYDGEDRLLVQAAEPIRALAVEPSTWSHAKTLFR